MDLSKILSISGKPDLYKHIAQSRNGIVIEGITDAKRINAFSTDKISSLQDIAIYTKDDDLPLNDIFKNIFKKEDGKEAISHKASNKEIKAYFSEILPDFDEDRVYVSDMKRVFKWYNILQKQGLIDLEEPEKEENEESNEENKESNEENKENKE